MKIWLAVGTGAGLSQVRWAWVTVGLVLTPADGGPASVLLQLCPVLKAGFEDMRGELLNLTKGRCTTLSPFFLTQGKLYVNYNHLAKQIKCSFEILVLEDG